MDTNNDGVEDTRANLKATATPNVGIPDPDTRRTLQNWLGYVSLGVAIVAMFFTFFPEVAFGSDIPDRAVQFVNSLVLLISGTYGLTVTRPNIPKF
ncbi:hypothetical protein SEA_NEFERTHENA_26 [Microbacterium phage Neferthena]|uniref:Uncharacterized protein n=1 Tax=Microbacterium phage Neferthena TaxID=2301539 RepID=A0A385D4I1_9CAUD|nr:holin [Microbacterium phage Neferthena]AXQ52890.1 hypothetical protein SEA_NEFERTHENA_26 [Microbacterium phage Neferthena]